MKLMEDNVYHQHGHYYLPLSLRNEDVIFLNGRTQAMNRVKITIIL